MEALEASKPMKILRSARQARPSFVAVTCISLAGVGFSAGLRTLVTEPEIAEGNGSLAKGPSVDSALQELVKYPAYSDLAKMKYGEAFDFSQESLTPEERRQYHNDWVRCFENKLLALDREQQIEFVKRHPVEFIGRPLMMHPDSQRGWLRSLNRREAWLKELYGEAVKALSEDQLVQLIRGIEGVRGAAPLLGPVNEAEDPDTGKMARRATFHDLHSFFVYREFDEDAFKELIRKVDPELDPYRLQVVRFRSEMRSRHGMLLGVGPPSEIMIFCKAPEGENQEP